MELALSSTDQPRAASSGQDAYAVPRGCCARCSALGHGLAFWKQWLEGAPSSIDLPADRQRPPLQTFSGDKQRMSIEPPLLERLRTLSQSHGATLFTTLLAAFSVLLSRYARQEDLVVGTHVSGRGRPEFESVIGPLENMLALRIDASGEPSFADFVARVHQSSQSAFSQQEIPFESLLKQLKLDRDMSRHPLFQIILTMQDTAVAGRAPTQPGVCLFDFENPAEEFDLSVEFAMKENGLDATFGYNTDLFDASTITRMMGHFQRLLDSAAENPSIKISRIPLLSEAERQQLLVEWNDTRVDYPTNVPLHKFIEEQVEKTPNAQAVIFESQRLTYRELNKRANQLAHYLKARGVGPDVLVGVCAERSPELVIALLASIKAGGAYVPLDPEYPRDRLQTMLRDANPPVVLTQSHLLDRLPQTDAAIFCLDRDREILESEGGENPDSNVGPEKSGLCDLYFGIHGQTERCAQRSRRHREPPALDAGHVSADRQDRVLQKTPFSFDVSVWEFFWPLMTGATLVVARPGGHRDPAYLVNLIAQEGITTLHFVPSMLSIFLEAAGPERCRSLRKVFASGEALPFELQQRFFARLGSGVAQSVRPNRSRRRRDLLGLPVNPRTTSRSDWTAYRQYANLHP